MRIRNILTTTALAALLPSLAFGYTGVFRSSLTQNTGRMNATGITVGDYNLDGAVDAAIPIAESNELFVFPGVKTCVGGEQGGFTCSQDGECTGGMCEANGQLRFPDSLPLSSFPSGVLQAKFDADALDDLIVARANDNTVVFLKGLGTSEYFAAPGDPVTVGQSPIGLASGDIDGNGTLDLVVANEGVSNAPGSVSILKGQGDGTFLLVLQPNPDDPEEPLNGAPAESGTRDVAVGNLDADPALDVLAINRVSNTVSVYSGDGDGILTPRGTLPTGAEPSDIALVDLNGDTKLDMVLATTNDDAVTVQFGNGDRTFAAAQSYPVGTAPTRLAIGDLNGDARLDIAVSNARSGDVSVLLAITPGTFAAARTYVADAEPQALALGDFNQDDVLDVATAAEGDSSASAAVLTNRGNGTLHGVEDVRVGNGPTALAVADLDGDGTSDMLVSGDSGQLAIFPARGDGFALPELLNIGGRTLGVAATDLNGDAQPDIVVADSMNNGLAVSLASGGGQFATRVLYPTTAGSPAGVTIGDFDGDGRPDLAASTIRMERSCLGGPNDGDACINMNDCAPGGICAALGDASVLLQQAGGGFGAARNTEVDETPIGIAAIDRNCDGKDDLLVANLASSSVLALQSNGDGSFTTVQTLDAVTVGTQPIALAVADFDRDGVDDFAVVNTVAPSGSANVHLFKGNCTGPYTVFPGPTLRVGELANSIVARDFTGDQKVDLAIVSQTSNDVCLLVGTGTGTMTRVGFGSCDRVSRMPIAVAAGDFDADGRYDAVSANNDPSANNVSVLSNCARDAGCDPNPPRPPATPLPGEAALRGDGNDDGRRSAADLVAVGAEVMDDDGFRVEAIGQKDPLSAPGVDANGDGRVDAQDRLAVASKIFGGG